MNYQFCEFREKELEDLYGALAMSFHISRGDLSIGFDTFKQWYWHKSDQIYTTPVIERNRLLPITSDRTFLTYYLDLDYWIGFDFPLLLRKAGNYKSVIIVAEDPLRNFGDKLLRCSKQDILLSTPFATHLEACRKSLKEYWDFHESLLQKGFDIYLTDINKIWIRKEGNKFKERFPEDLATSFKNTLKAEISLIKPELIIAYGKPAEQALRNMDLDKRLRVIYFPHPSKSANGTWKKNLVSYYSDATIRCTSDNKVSYMIAHVDC